MIPHRLAGLRSRLRTPLCVGLALSLMAGTALAQVATVTIDWNATYQPIDGFGTAQAGFAPSLYTWPEPQRSQIMDLAFSQAKGIGLTILRSAILPELEPSKGAWNYTDTAQVWIMKEALNRSPVKLFASVWSPPAWMKDNGEIIRGKLKPENYQDFADFLSHYAAEYARANGVNIYAVSMTNEPDNIFPPDEPCMSDTDCKDDIKCVDGKCKTGWDTCAWTSNEIASFLGHYLSPTFAANRIAAKVIAPETATWDDAESYLRGTYNNPTATARLDIVAAHLYGGSPSLVFQNALNHGKTIWQTEASLRHPVWDFGGALSWAKTIHDGLTSAQVSGWVWWVLALWPNYDQNLISLDDASTGAFSVSKTFWALGNFSRFIRPGFVRIGTTTDAPSQLHMSAYKDPTTGQFVIVAINTGTSDLPVNFRTLGFTYSSVTPFITSTAQNLAPQPAVSLANTITIPAQSIVSYVGPPVVPWLSGILWGIQLEPTVSQ